MSQIKHLLALRLSDWLTTKLITAVSDNTVAKVVKPYRFQQNPLVENIYVWVTGNDPQNPEDRDARIGMRGMEDLGISVPSGEIGGGHLWWRKGKAELGCYFIRDRYSQEEAARVAGIVLGRALYWLERATVTDLVDEFGEQAIQVFVTANTWMEGGGPTNQYYWRGEIWWQALTERPY